MLQHPVPDAILARMGDVTVSFAMLESVIQSVASSLIRDGHRIGQIITAELSFRHLRALTLSLYRERYAGSDDYDALRALMKRAERLEDLRNQLTHSVWAGGELADENVTRIKATAKEKHGLRFDFVNVSAHDLGQVADDIKRLAADVQRFWLNHAT